MRQTPPLRLFPQNQPAIPKIPQEMLGSLGSLQKQRVAEKEVPSLDLTGVRSAACSLRPRFSFALANSH